MDGALTQTYTYDVMSRLTGVASTADNESFAYDSDGNRTFHVWNGSDITFTMDTHSNRLISTSTASGSTTYGYDADGNTLTANGNTLFGYGGFGLVTGANGYMSYANGAEGQRLRNTNTVASTQTYFAPDRSGVPLAEDQAGLWLDYVYLNGRLVSVVQSGQVYAAHADQTGRPLVLTNSSKAVAWEAENLPYPISGYVTFNRFGDFNLGYPGQYQDPGIIHNGSRDYNAYLGRYMQSDPIGLAGGINTYAYVGDNPVSNVDPLGLCQKCTEMQKLAAQLAAASEYTSQFTERTAAYTGIAAGVFAAGEGPSFGTDSPLTIGMAGATVFLAKVSITTGLASAVFNAYASGNMNSFGRFAAIWAVSAGIGAIAEHVPGLSPMANGLEQAAGVAADNAMPPDPNLCQ